MKDRKEVIERLDRALFHVAALSLSVDKAMLETIEEVGMSIKDAMEFLNAEEEEDHG